MMSLMLAGNSLNLMLNSAIRCLWAVTAELWNIPNPHLQKDVYQLIGLSNISPYNISLFNISLFNISPNIKLVQLY